MSFTIEEIKTVPQVLRKALFKQEHSIDETLTTLVRLAEKARREGLLALEDDLENIEDNFMRKGIQLVVDGTDHNMVRDVLETDLMYLESRHAKGRSILEAAAASAPAFGMIGTLIGLVKMLSILGTSRRKSAPAWRLRFYNTPWRGQAYLISHRWRGSSHSTAKGSAGA